MKIIFPPLFAKCPGSEEESLAGLKINLVHRESSPLQKIPRAPLESHRLKHVENEAGRVERETKPFGPAVSEASHSN